MSEGGRRLFHGGCHCGAVRVTLETAIAPDNIDVRADQCGFCRRHGGHTATDPKGSVEITAQASALQKYRFGLKTADFLVCRVCGVYVAAYMDDASGARATLNINVLDDRPLFSKPPRPVSFEDETLESRRARRLKGWTPARLIVSCQEHH